MDCTSRQRTELRGEVQELADMRWPGKFASVPQPIIEAMYDKIMRPPNPIGHYHSIMRLATSYEQWSTAAAILDQLEGNIAFCPFSIKAGKEEWKQDPLSPDYDYELILTRLGQLRKARAEKDYPSMIYLLRTSLSRNFGDIGKMEVTISALIILIATPAILPYPHWDKNVDRSIYCRSGSFA